MKLRIILLNLRVFIFILLSFVFWFGGVEAGRLKPNADLAFLPLGLLDIPISIIFSGILETIYSKSALDAYLAYFIIFGVFGSLQWYLAGILFEKLFRKN